MPKQANQKLKLLYLMRILLEETDELHHITINDIIKKLDLHDIKAERKSLYSDIDLLRQYGIDIISERTKTVGYYVGERDFELPELKLLVDSVQASKFITKKKSNVLIKKIEGLTNKHNAKDLQRQVYVADRVKSLNETIYYNVDTLHNAIIEGNKIAFKYYEYGVDKKKKLRNNSEDYIISPYSLSFSDENYYVISHYPKYQNLTHFRVDRMTDIKILCEKSEPIQNITDQNFNLGEYSKKIFNMYAGKTVMVKLECDNSLVNAIIDRFGEDVSIRDVFEKSFVINVNINISPTFFAWVFTFEDKIKILSPSNVVEEFKSRLNNVQNVYSL